MKHRSFLNRTVAGIVCLAVLVSVAELSYAAAAQNPPQAQKQPVAQKQPAAQKQPQAKPSATPRKSEAGKKIGAAKLKQSPEDPTRLQKDLEHFAKDCIMRMNRQRRPGISNKEVKRLPDGAYQARYMAVDPDSVETSYNPVNGNKTVKYIGRMYYHEIEYVCVAKTQKQALAGPFSEANRVPVTELIKYKKGKWSY